MRHFNHIKLLSFDFYFLHRESVFHDSQANKAHEPYILSCISFLLNIVGLISSEYVHWSIHKIPQGGWMGSYNARALGPIASQGGPDQYFLGNL